MRVVMTMTELTFRELATGRVGAWIHAYAARHGDTMATAVQDMITDILHVLAADDDTAETLLRYAYSMWLSETSDDLAGVPTGATTADHIATMTRAQLVTLARACDIAESLGDDMTDTRDRIDARLTQLDTNGDESNE